MVQLTIRSVPSICNEEWKLFTTKNEEGTGKETLMVKPETDSTPRPPPGMPKEYHEEPNSTQLSVSTEIRTDYHLNTSMLRSKH